MECITPYITRSQDNLAVPVPCGKCPACVSRRVSQWSFRLMQEDKTSITSHFITLTYDTSHVPITPNGFMALDKRDIQLFFKRLRKSLPEGSQPIKYYTVGEYGGRTNRPHYHAILFNCPVELIQPAWQKGEVHYGQVTGASVGYTLKYMSKLGKIPMHKNDDRTPEFALMSKGIGVNYITEDMVKWHHADKLHRMYCNLLDGRKIGMPRYYKDKIYETNERKYIGEQMYLELRNQQDKEILEADSRYFLDKFQKHQQDFRKMQKNANLNNII